MGTLENSVQLIGRPGMDPEVKNVGERKNVRFTLATNDYTYNDNHELERSTSWHNIVNKNTHQESRELLLFSETLFYFRIF